MEQVLFPTLECLRTEHVLVQAWKKTAAYLRQHSWYADTSELDYQSLRLPDFIRELRERLNAHEPWSPTRLDMVPAPKSHPWQLQGDGDRRLESGNSRKVRPLAHVAFDVQVLATAMLLCLADQIEMRMGDPLLPIERVENHKKVLAYCYRLFLRFSKGRASDRTHLINRERATRRADFWRASGGVDP